MNSANYELISLNALRVTLQVSRCNYLILGALQYGIRAFGSVDHMSWSEHRDRVKNILGIMTLLLECGLSHSLIVRIVW